MLWIWRAEPDQATALSSWWSYFQLAPGSLGNSFAADCPEASQRAQYSNGPHMSAQNTTRHRLWKQYKIYILFKYSYGWTSSRGIALFCSTICWHFHWMQICGRIREIFNLIKVCKLLLEHWVGLGLHYFWKAFQEYSILVELYLKCFC